MPEPNGSTRSAAERRAISAVLDSVSQDESLHKEYLLKGGLALQLAYGSPRRSDDLDFNAVHPTANEITESTEHRLRTFSQKLDDVLAQGATQHGFERLTTAHPRFSEEIPTLMTEVEYTTSGGESGSVKLQLTLSEIVCATRFKSVDGIQVHAASVEDILAEKLKAILQQITRDKVRSSDIFDVWYFTTRSNIGVDPDLVTQYMIEKKKQWQSMPQLAKGQFRRKSVVQHSAQEYSELGSLLPPSFELVPFREAYACVLRFVDCLALPT